MKRIAILLVLCAPLASKAQKLIVTNNTTCKIGVIAYAMDANPTPTCNLDYTVPYMVFSGPMTSSYVYTAANLLSTPPGAWAWTGVKAFAYEATLPFGCLGIVSGNPDAAAGTPNCSFWSAQPHVGTVITNCNTCPASTTFMLVWHDLGGGSAQLDIN